MKSGTFYGLLDDVQLREYLSVLDPELFNVEHQADRLFKLLQASHHATAGVGLAAFLSWSSKSPSLQAISDTIADTWNQVQRDDSLDVNYLATELSLKKNFSLKDYINKNVKVRVDSAISTAIDGITTHAGAEIAVQKLAEIPHIPRIKLEAALRMISKKSGISMASISASYRSNRGGQVQDSIWPHPQSSSGNYPCTFENFCYFVELYRISIKFNLMTGRLHIVVADRYHDSRIPDSRYDMDFMLSLIAQAKIAAKSKTFILGFAMRYANHVENIYHPVQHWLESEPYQGGGQYEKLLNSLTPCDRDKPLMDSYLRCWLLQGIEAIYEPSGVRSSVMLILQGESGLGKTRWLTNLIPIAYQHEWFDNVPLDRFKEWVSATRADCPEHWLCEVMNVNDILVERSDYTPNDARLQRYLDQNIDKQRELPNYRRTFFAGTHSTPSAYTGWVKNRRYLVLQLEAIDFQVQVDCRQLWLEVRAWYKDGLRHYMDVNDIRAHLTKQQFPTQSLPPVHIPHSPGSGS